MIDDKFAIALVNRHLVTVGHIPKFMSKLEYFFLENGGHVKREITGVMKYWKNLEQSGLEIPARLTISNANKRVADVMKEKLNPSLRSTEILAVNPNNFSIEYLVYYKFGCFVFSFFVYCIAFL